MTLLSDTDLSGLRTAVTASLPGTAVIQTQVWASDGGGGGSQTWTAAGTEPCRIAPMGGFGADEKQMGGRISADAQFVVTLPSDTSIDTDARLLIDGDTYNVEAVRDRSWNVSTRVEVVRAT